MSIALTNEQLQAVPVRVTDPETSREYIVVKAEVYDRLSLLLNDDVRGMQKQLADLQPEDWEAADNYEQKL